MSHTASNKKVLYLSYDGMTDPLGQSQVLPYLIGLAQNGNTITLMSFEKESSFKKRKETVEIKLAAVNIAWIPLQYTKRPPVLSTLWDIFKMYHKAASLCRAEKTDIVHCRSYISALVGLQLKRKLQVKFIFDMRGFWADERVEGKIWDIRKPLYKKIYGYFKKKEKEFLDEADYVISLTEAAKNEIGSWRLHTMPAVAVIPCCVDTALFRPGRADRQLLEKLGLQAGDFVLSYLGSLGTWYMLDEMLLFFREVCKVKEHAKFLFITPDAPEGIRAAARSAGIEESRIVIVRAEREEVPALLQLSHVSLFFIKPTFSKKASSPTKQAEVLSMGLPVICNGGIGDTDMLIEKEGVGIVLKDLSPASMEEAVRRIDTLLEVPGEKIRKMALTHFSLDKGVETYQKVYDHL